MLPMCSPRKRPRRPRKRIATQPNSPSERSTCQSRPRSRYSKPWLPSHMLVVHPWMPASSPPRLPTTTIDQRAEEPVREQVLMARLVPGDERGEEDARRQERRRRPRGSRAGRARCARGCTGATAARSMPKKLGEIGAIVLRCAADQHLHEEQDAHHEEEPGAGALRGRQLDVARALEEQSGLSRPCQPRKSHRPKAANSRPEPPSSAASEIML